MFIIFHNSHVQFTLSIWTNSLLFLMYLWPFTLLALTFMGLWPCFKNHNMILYKWSLKAGMLACFIWRTCYKLLRILANIFPHFVRDSIEIMTLRYLFHLAEARYCWLIHHFQWQQTLVLLFRLMTFPVVTICAQFEISPMFSPFFVAVKIAIILLFMYGGGETVYFTFTWVCHSMLVSGI